MSSMRKLFWIWLMLIGLAAAMFAAISGNTIAAIGVLSISTISLAVLEIVEVIEAKVPSHD